MKHSQNDTASQAFYFHTKLIVGLGNPGKSYVNNRHNVGFQCIDHFAQAHRISVKERKARAKVGFGEVVGKRVVLAKPRTFMNASGEAVGRLVRQLGAPLDDLLVIYDDLDLPLGKVRIRQRGGAAGHKGIQSIIVSLGSDQFPRIRVGIGRPDGDEVAYVLSDFTPAEKEIVNEVVATVSDAIYCILTEGIEAAMNRYN
ncbi:MAG: aminoacyl-tRNA hydrolase [Dehalococcoidia bacterium]|nr:aminoacyl-tRNA hydrolase [Dehalococcoidia bacterium]